MKKIKVGLIIDEFFGGAGTAYGGYGFLARRLIAKYIPNDLIQIDVLLGRSNKNRYFAEKIKAEILEKGKEIAILAVGNMVRTAVQVTENLRNCGYEPTLVNMRFVKPLDMDLLEILREDHSLWRKM